MRIAIIDDDPGNIDLLVKALNEIGNTKIEYAIDTNGTGAIGYITKPFESEQIIKIAARLEKLLETTNGAKEVDPADILIRNGLVASTDGSKYFIHNVNEILYFSIENKRVNLRTMQASYTVKQSMKELEAILKGTSFIRCQKSYIVNLKYVESIDVWFNQTYLLNMKGIKERIPVSRMFSKTLKKMMLI